MTGDPTPARLGEAAAREVLLLQAFESIEPRSPSWSADDSAWATRAAREVEASANDRPEAFLAARAGLALRRLLPREPALAAAWAKATRRRSRLGFLAIGIGFVAGVLADAIGSSQRINLLAPPVWTVVAWNLVVYGLLLVGAVRGALKTPARPGRFVGFAERLTGFVRRVPWPDTGSGPTAAALRVFAGRWSALVAPLAVSRAVVLLHAAAAALGVGLVAGLYARGLVLDYRAAWESTFLSPADVHAALSTLLAPASALSGVALPDLASVAALRAAHGDPTVGAPAAPWIHLYAVTLGLAVIAPRIVLAVVGALRVRWAAAHLRLPQGDAYFRRLELQRRGEVVRVQLCPYAQTPAPAAIDAVRRLLAEALGDGLVLAVAPTTAFGAEDDGAPAIADASVVVALFDLGATPEPEHQGRFLAGLAARSNAATIACIDEAAFRRRFGHDARRLDERRAAWSRQVAAQGSVPVFADLSAADAPGSVASLRAALASPARLPH